MSVYFIDCEFDGHGGELLSIGVVRDDGGSIHIRTDIEAKDAWVRANVVPVMDSHSAPMSQWVPLNEVGPSILHFMGDDPRPVVVADSPVDIGRFCKAISTGATGEWQSVYFEKMTFIVESVDCYPTDLPGAVQHNAWWDAMALVEALARNPRL
jgi:hypothetical protein